MVVVVRSVLFFVAVVVRYIVLLSMVKTFEAVVVRSVVLISLVMTFRDSCGKIYSVCGNDVLWWS